MGGQWANSAHKLYICGKAIYIYDLNSQCEVAQGGVNLFFLILVFTLYSNGMVFLGWGVGTVTLYIIGRGKGGEGVGQDLAKKKKKGLVTLPVWLCRPALDVGLINGLVFGVS